MAPIPDEETVLIALDYLKVKNTASRGVVEFLPPRFLAADPHIVVPVAAVAEVEAGEGFVRLIPTNAGTFQVTEKLDGQKPFVWHINVPPGVAGTERSLWSFAPVQPIVQGVSVNTMRSGNGAPASNLGIDGDYYYDVAGKVWYGPKALGAWPAGFSVVGPAGTNGTNGTDGADGQDGSLGPAGPAGTRIRVVSTRITAGTVNPLPATAGWKYPGEATGLPAYFTEEIQAAEGDYVEVDCEAMKNGVTNAFFDFAVRMGAPGAYTYPWHASTGTNTPAPEGMPSWYRSDFASKGAPPGLYVTASHLQGGFVRFVLANKSAGSGILFAEPDYQFRWLLKNLGPAPA